MPITHIIAALVGMFTILVAADPARADFVGTLELIPSGCEKKGQCKLAQEFGFIDSGGIGWLARKGLPTDGASIPSWAQPIVGKAFDKSFIKAAVVHDHYCDRHVRPWRQTHKVFYEALRASGVPKGKASVMYFAILVGGPKWIKLVEGKPCPIGEICINQVDITATVPGGFLGIDENGNLVATRQSEYDTARFTNAMFENVPALEAAGDMVTPEEVEARAAKVMQGDFFFENDDEIGTGLSLKLQAE